MSFYVDFYNLKDKGFSIAEESFLNAILKTEIITVKKMIEINKIDIDFNNFYPILLVNKMIENESLKTKNNKEAKLSIEEMQNLILIKEVLINNSDDNKLIDYVQTSSKIIGAGQIENFKFVLEQEKLKIKLKTISIIHCNFKNIDNSLYSKVIFQNQKESLKEEEKESFLSDINIIEFLLKGNLTENFKKEVDKNIANFKNISDGINNGCINLEEKISNLKLNKDLISYLKNSHKFNIKREFYLNAAIFYDDKILFESVGIFEAEVYKSANIMILKKSRNVYEVLINLLKSASYNKNALMSNVLINNIYIDEEYNLYLNSIIDNFDLDFNKYDWDRIFKVLIFDKSNISLLKKLVECGYQITKNSLKGFESENINIQEGIMSEEIKNYILSDKEIIIYASNNKERVSNQFHLELSKINIQDF
jgi:hypothetical protein